jgi:hypothetical protein
MSMEQSVEWELTGGTQTLKKNHRSTTLYTMNATWSVIESGPTQWEAGA